MNGTCEAIGRNPRYCIQSAMQSKAQTEQDYNALLKEFCSMVITTAVLHIYTRLYYTLAL